MQMVKTKRNSKQTAILDAAEALFAHMGFHGTSMRAVAKEAGVELALVQYHFGKKTDLFEHTIARRANLLSEKRAERLDEAERDASPGNPSLEAIVACFIEPVFELRLTGTEGWRNYVKLIAQMTALQEWKDVTSRYFDPTAHRMALLLRRALPEADSSDVYFAYELMVSTMITTFSDAGRFESVMKKRKPGKDTHAREVIIAFCVAGISAACSISKS